MKQGVVGRSSSFLERLNTREKMLLLLMLTMFTAMGTAVFVMNFNSSLDELEASIDSYDQALRLLEANQNDLLSRIEEAERVANQIENNDLQLHGYLERECIATNVDRPSNYSDNVIPRQGGNLLEIETRATINAVDPLPLSRLLHRIDNSEELIDIKVIDLQPARGQRGRYRLDLTVSTYRRPEPES